MQKSGQPATSVANLTAREIDVLRRTALGRTNADVAADLGVTVHAVKFHLASIFKKLNVRNRTQAAAAYLAFAHGDGRGAIEQ